MEHTKLGTQTEAVRDQRDDANMNTVT
jgi:hypothetical protein